MADTDWFAVTLRESLHANINTGQLHASAKNARREIHQHLKQANYDVVRYQFNTMASAGMKILNTIQEQLVEMETAPGKDTLDDTRLVVTEGLWILLRLLAPITPHVCDHLWRELGFGADIINTPWPEPDQAALVQDEIKYVIQINGKVRSEFVVPADADDELIRREALRNEKVSRFIDGNAVKKVIIVPGRLVNIVLA